MMVDLRDQKQRWDIFCTVIDNYGDIGVTWRLARQLVNEYELDVHLWVDDLGSFNHILPELNKAECAQHHQCVQGVTIHHWCASEVGNWQAGRVVIEAFACELPSVVISKMQQNSHPPIWLNLEYLSAESWVQECHGLQSMHHSGLKKYFFFPGFGSKTGGLICEQGLFVQRALFQSSRAHKLAHFNQLGLQGIQATDLVISLFAYESAVLTFLAKYFESSTQKVHLLVPKGRSLANLSAYFANDVQQLQGGERVECGNLVIHVLPMTDQQGYDRLLWSCDLNIVRGEDSFVRAQWAAKPFIWHIYAQEAQAHIEKLEAFMQLYCDNLAPEIAAAYRHISLALNQDDVTAVDAQWQQLNSFMAPLTQHALQWSHDAYNDADLATRLMQFVKTH